MSEFVLGFLFGAGTYGLWTIYRLEIIIKDIEKEK